MPATNIPVTRARRNEYMKFIIAFIALSITNYAGNIPANPSVTGTGDARTSSQIVSRTRATAAIPAPIPLKSITPDFFEIDSLQFEKFRSARYSNWFITKDRKSGLYFVPYTDYSITTAVLTGDHKLPEDIKNLLYSEGIKYQDTVHAIRSTGFVSRKGFKLGVSKEYALKIYGAPKTKKKNGDRETLSWNFKMKEGVKYKDGTLTPFILDGLAFDVELTFRKNKLYTLIYRYEVP